MSAISSILRLRRRLVSNRLGDLSARRRRRGALLLLMGAAALLVGGHLAAPALMEPPIDLATPRGLSPDDLPAGAAALEAAFWLTALLAAVLNFRILELLFRRADVLAMQTLPIRPSALFVDRLASSLLEAFVVSLGTTLFFVPLLWHGGVAAFFASSAMVFGGLIFGALVSLAIMLSAARQLVPQDGPDGDKRSSMADAYGGAGQILLYAPALALGAIVVLALLWKLLLGEPLRLGYVSEPFLIGSAIVVGSALFSLLSARKTFVGHYYAIAPRFREADAAEYQAVIDYQTSSFRQPTRWERGLPAGAALATRALLLDDDRRIAGGRIGYVVVLLLAVIALMMLDLDALPMWAVAIVPAALAGVVINPWHRLASRAELLDVPLGLPLAEPSRRAAADRVALREFLLIGIPYAIAAALIVGYFRGVGADGYLAAAAALGGGLAIAGVVTLARRFNALTSATRWLPTVVVALFAATAIVWLPAALIFGFVTFIIAVGASRLAAK